MWRENLRCQIFGKIGHDPMSRQTGLRGTHAGLRGVTRQNITPRHSIQTLRHALGNKKIGSIF